MSYPQYALLKKYSLKHGINMTQVIREALDVRLSDSSQYLIGFNTALDEAIQAIHNNKAAKMRFPSGASFADLVTADITKLKRKEVNEETTNGRSTTQDAGREEQTDPDLGL